MADYVNMIDFLNFLTDRRESADDAMMGIYRKMVLLELSRDLIQMIPHNFVPMDTIPFVGECNGCKWKWVRPQKCSCCRRNRNLKDCYEIEETEDDEDDMDEYC